MIAKCIVSSLLLSICSWHASALQCFQSGSSNKSTCETQTGGCIFDRDLYDPNVVSQSCSTDMSWGTGIHCTDVFFQRSYIRRCTCFSDYCNQPNIDRSPRLESLECYTNNPGEPVETTICEYGVCTVTSEGNYKCGGYYIDEEFVEDTYCFKAFGEVICECNWDRCNRNLATLNSSAHNPPEERRQFIENKQRTMKQLAAKLTTVTNNIEGGGGTRVREKHRSAPLCSVSSIASYSFIVLPLNLIFIIGSYL